MQVSGRTTEACRLVITGEGPPVEHRRCLLVEADLKDFSPRARKYLLAMRVPRDPIEVPEGDELVSAVQLAESL